VWNGYGVCCNLASSGEPHPLLHMTTLTTAGWCYSGHSIALVVFIAVAPGVVVTADVSPVAVAVAIAVAVVVTVVA